MSYSMKELLDKYIAEIKKIYGTHLQEVILYGSYARGDFKEDSDIDIMILLDIMLMCHKVTHKNLIDSSPLFRYCLTHASCNFFVKTIDSDTSKEI